MIFDLLLESQIYKDLSMDKQRNNLSHAYLVLGPDLETRESFINLVSHLLLCPSGGCMICPVCKKIQGDSHPDILRLNKDGKLKVDGLSSFYTEVYTKPIEGNIKLFFIDNIDIISTSQIIQNKLLKLYEEPPKNVIIFMFSRAETGILPTIRSRAKSLHLPRFKSKQIFDELLAEGVPLSIAESAAVLSGGRFDKAHLFSEKEEYLEIYDKCWDFLLNLKSTKDVVNYINDEIFARENIETTLEILQVILKDILIIVSKSQTEMSTMDRDYYLEEISKGHNEGSVALAILATTEAKKMFNSNVNETSIAETLMINILMSKYEATKR